VKRVLLLHLDGKIPNLALLRIAGHHRAAGDEVVLQYGAQFGTLFDPDADSVYASAVFIATRPLVARLFQVYPQAIVGGTGWSITRTVEDIGIVRRGPLDYSIYPRYQSSIGFTQRGCRLRCPFCVVGGKEGAVAEEQSVAEIWRGDPWPRDLILLDNDFFGQVHWRERIEEIRTGHFRVNFNQGINARFLTDEAAEAIASVDYYDARMKSRRIYTAWDNLKDEDRLFAGLNRLVRYGVKPDHIMVYILCGYWPSETHEDREYRRRRLRDFGARPYPMPYTRTPELIGFQRWVVGAYDKRVPWRDWIAAKYEPRGLRPAPTFPLFECLP
jgi:hypothetical protein